MIRMHVAAVILVRDGFTGLPVEASGLRCFLDGRPFRCEGKPGGFLLLVNIPDGVHRVELAAAGFQNEVMELEMRSDLVCMEHVSLKPSDRYFFRQEPVRLLLTATDGKSPLARKELWLTTPSPPEFKITQPEARKGEIELRVFFKGPSSRLPAPGYFLVDGENGTELVTVTEVTEDTATLLSPLERSHKRAAALLPAQRYVTDGDGKLTAVFRAPGAVCVYFEGKVRRLELTQTANEALIDLK